MKTLILITALFIPLTAMAEGNATPAPDPQCTQFSDKLQGALADMVNKSVQVAGDAKDFLIKETPDVIRQLLVWKFWESLLPQAFCLLAFLIVGTVFVRTTVKNGDWREGYATREQDSNYHGYKAGDKYATGLPANGIPKMVFGIIKAIASIVLLITFVAYMNLDWLKIWVAPKVYLIEYAKSLVTKK